MLIISLLLTLSLLASELAALLRQEPTETRDVQSLDGLWWFVREPANSLGVGLRGGWGTRPGSIAVFKNSTRLPVPSAYNDLFTSTVERDHIGWVWYERQFFVPAVWLSTSSSSRSDETGETQRQRLVNLKFEGVNYAAVVFVNGHRVTEHVGGHVPFEADVSRLLLDGAVNTLTVAVNNTLDHHTIPPGEFRYLNDTKLYPDGYFEFATDFDFFNYAGILRSVYLYATDARQYLKDIHVHTYTNGSLVIESLVCGTALSQVHQDLQLFSRSGRLVAAATNVLVETFTRYRNEPCRRLSSTLRVRQPKLWWPLGMCQPAVGYLYTLKASLLDGSKRPLDVYRLSVGLREVRVDGNQLLINDQPFYCQGYGMHEDADLRGRGFDPVVMTKDLNLLEWTGANCFRTSHYPYTELRYEECDRRGIVVIDETPAVGARLVSLPKYWHNQFLRSSGRSKTSCGINGVFRSYFTAANRRLHARLLRDMVERDRNHASVCAWSISNEAQTYQTEARPYYKWLIELAHELDHSRPVTMVYGPSTSGNDKTADLLDFICVNRYYGWYSHIGHPEVIGQSLYADLVGWHEKFGKPIMMTEYGAGSVAGMNTLPGADFSESYQAEILHETHLVFDHLRKAQTFFVGELVWNFADFMTQQGTTRVVGNRKGVFTRQRQPKLAAYVMRRRYRQLNARRCNVTRETSPAADWIDHAGCEL